MYNNIVISVKISIKYIVYTTSEYRDSLAISYQQNIIDSMVRNAYNYNIMMTRDVTMLGPNDSSL